METNIFVVSRCLLKKLIILEPYQNQNSDKVWFIIYADVECFTEKIDSCKNNTENSSKKTVAKLIPSIFSMLIISSFYSIGKGKDCIKKFCKYLR